MPLSPWASHKYYVKRATSENWIEWCKNQMASGSILTQQFWANSAIFQTCILAYKKIFNQEFTNRLKLSWNIWDSTMILYC